MPTARTIHENPDGWDHLQRWFERTNDPLRPWNVSAISRQLGMPQAVVRSLLTAPKGTTGMSRVGFTQQRLRRFQELFHRYGYRVAVPWPEAGASFCHAVAWPAGVHPR